jgi:hypothetical protein
MQETPQQYRDRLAGYMQGQTPEKVRTSTPKKIERLIAGKSQARLAKRPAPEKWSVVEILAHLADTELVMGYRIRTVAGAPGTAIQGFDQDAWAREMNYAKRPAKKSLAAFRALRENNLELLKSLRREQWEHFGMHSERGKESITLITQMMAGHDLNHIRQIEAILNPR